MLRKDDSRHHELVRYRKGKLYLKLASTDPEGTNVAFPLYISPLFMFFPRPRSTRDQGGGELTSIKLYKYFFRFQKVYESEPLSHTHFERCDGLSPKLKLTRS